MDATDRLEGNGWKWLATVDWDGIKSTAAGFWVATPQTSEIVCPARLGSPGLAGGRSPPRPPNAMPKAQKPGRAVGNTIIREDCSAVRIQYCSYCTEIQ